MRMIRMIMCDSTVVIDVDCLGTITVPRVRKGGGGSHGIVISQILTVKSLRYRITRQCECLVALDLGALDIDSQDKVNV